MKKNEAVTTNWARNITRAPLSQECHTGPVTRTSNTRKNPTITGFSCIQSHWKPQTLLNENQKERADKQWQKFMWHHYSIWVWPRTWITGNMKASISEVEGKRWAGDRLGSDGFDFTVCTHLFPSCGRLSRIEGLLTSEALPVGWKPW